MSKKDNEDNLDVEVPCLMFGKIILLPGEVRHFFFYKTDKIAKEEFIGLKAQVESWKKNQQIVAFISLDEQISNEDFAEYFKTGTLSRILDVFLEQKDKRLIIKLKGIGRCYVKKIIRKDNYGLLRAKVEPLPLVEKMSDEAWKSIETREILSGIILLLENMCLLFDKGISATSKEYKEEEETKKVIIFITKIKVSLLSLRSANSFDYFLKTINDWLIRTNFDHKVLFFSSNTEKEQLIAVAKIVSDITEDIASFLLDSGNLKSNKNLVNPDNSLVIAKDKTKTGLSVKEEIFQKIGELSQRLNSLSEKAEKRGLLQDKIKKSKKTIKRPRVLDYNTPGKQAQKYFSLLDEYIIGQSRGKDKVVEILLNINERLGDSNKPIGKIALFGPSGVGKTEIIYTMARIKTGDPEGLTKIDGADYQERHDVSRLKGAPPGYVGYDKDPWLSQDRIDQPALLFIQKKLHIFKKKIEELEKNVHNFTQNDEDKINSIKKRLEICQTQAENPFSIVLFDEIEKMHPDAYLILLSILNDGYLVLANGQKVSFKNSVIAITGNVKGGKISNMSKGVELGFKGAQPTMLRDKHREIWEVVKAGLKKIFSSALLGRLGYKNIISCDLLTYEQILEIFDKRTLKELLDKISKHRISFHIKVDDEVRRFLVDTCLKDPDLGVRSLSDLSDEWIKKPIIFLLSKDEDEGGIVANDMIRVRLGKNKKLQFILEKERGGV